MSFQTECLACGRDGLVEVLNLGDQHPVNALKSAQVESTRYPLRLVSCTNCGHAQQAYLVEPTELFSDYFYASSTSISLDEYSRQFVETVSKAFGAKLRVLEIASNDGILLKYLSGAGFQATGIDPASRMVERAILLGLNAIEGFWPDAAPKLAGARFDLIIGQNVLAHTPDPVNFLKGVEEALAEDGLAIFQTSQADMVLRNEFDTIYHEHSSFFCENSAREAGARAGLKLLGTAYTPIHGTSPLFIFGRNDKSLNRANQPITKFGAEFPTSNTGISPLAARLRSSRLKNDWAEFGIAANAIITQLSEKAIEVQVGEQKVVAVGASAKGITALRAAGIDADGLVDEAQDKIGIFVDGISKPISSLENELLLDDCVVFFTAWNFSRELSRKLIGRGVSPSSKAVLFFPEVHRESLEWLSKQD